MVESSARSCQQLPAVIAVIIAHLPQTNQLGEIADLVHQFVLSTQGIPRAKQHLLIRIVGQSVITAIIVIEAAAIDLSLLAIADIQETTLAFIAII